MKVLLRIVKFFPSLCKTMENCHRLCVEVSPILLPLGHCFRLIHGLGCILLFPPCGVQKNKHFLTDKLVFCLFNISGGHRKVDGGAEEVASLFRLVSTQGR